MLQTGLLPPKERMCHRTGFAKSCFECVTQHGCQLWQGLDAVTTTGEKTTAYNCIDAMNLAGQLEIAKKLNELGAAIESFRNETLRLNTVNIIRETERAIAEVMPKALPVQELKALPDANS